MKTINKIMYSNGSHAWLKVARDELRELEILDQISGWSKVFRDNIYLEEDLDYLLYVRALETKQPGTRLNLTEKYSDRCRVQNYDFFKGDIGK